MPSFKGSDDDRRFLICTNLDFYLIKLSVTSCRVSVTLLKRPIPTAIYMNQCNRLTHKHLLRLPMLKCLYYYNGDVRTQKNNNRRIRRIYSNFIQKLRRNKIIRAVAYLKRFNITEFRRKRTFFSSCV